MKRYQLPERLGGGIVECEEYEKDGNDWVWFSVGDWMYHCRADALTEVEPPVPPEPPNDAVMVGHSGRIWLCGSGWFNPRRHGETEYISWAQLHGEDGPLTQMVPDPVASAPELPWTLGDHQDRIAVTANNLVWIHLKPDYHSPEEAELRATAILRAVREARAAK